MSRTHSILGDHSTLLVLSTSDGVIRRSDLGSISELFEGTIISLALLKCVSYQFHVLGVAHENESDVLQQL